MNLNEGLSNVFKSQNMIIIMSNIIFFIMVQTAFFYFIASKQFNNVLLDKVDIITNYANNNPDVKYSIKETLESEKWQEIYDIAKDQKIERSKENVRLIIKWILPIIIFGLALLIYFVSKLRIKKENWSNVDNALLILVVGAFSTELLFFFGIVSKYNFYGDQQIYNNLLQKTRDKVLDDL